LSARPRGIFARATTRRLKSRSEIPGTDYPYEDLDECFDFLENLGLSTEEKAALYEGNASRLGITA
jgi:predicted TIM-barrel fold metal-dependent hydrolase